MKKLITISLLSLFLVTPFFTFAATSAGLTPNSPFYFFDTLSEKIVLFFTFNPEKKAIKALDYAEKRLAEVKTLTEEGGNADAIKTSIANYERNIALAAEKSKEVKDEGQKENLLNLVTDNASKNQETLAAVLIKVPEEAKQAITQAIEASKKGQEEAQRQIAELKQEVATLKQEVADLKKQQKTEPTSVQDVDTKTSIKELKEEIKELKKQTEVSAVPVVSTAPVTSPQIGVKTEDLPLILTNSEGRSFPIDNPSINRQRVQDLIDVGFFVKQGKLPEGIKNKSNETSATSATPATPATPAAPSIPATTPATPTIPATPTSSPTPTQSSTIYKELKITAGDSNFCSGPHSTLGTSCGSSVVYSERKGGEVYSQVKYDVPITISINDPQGKIVVPNNNPDGTSRTPQLLEGNPVTISTQWISGDGGKPGARFTYYPSNLGAEPYTFCSNAADPTCSGFRITRTVTVTANGITTTKTFTSRYYPPEPPKPALPYFVANINFDRNTIANDGVDPIKATIVTKDSTGKILPNKSVQVQAAGKTENLVSDSNGVITTTITTTESAGTHYLTLKAEDRSYSKSYEVINYVPNPEIIPIKTFYSYTGSIHQGNPGVIGLFKIKMSPNSDIQLLCKAINVVGNATNGASFNAYIYAETANGRLGICPNPWFSNVGKEYPTGSDGVSVIQYSLWIDTLYLDNSYLTANSNILKFNIEDLKVKDMKTGIIKSVSSVPTFELEFVKP